MIQYNHKEKRKGDKKMKNITIKVFSVNGLTYFVEKKNMVAAQLYRIGHLLRRTGYQTEIVED